MSFKDVMTYKRILIWHVYTSVISWWLACDFLFDEKLDLTEGIMRGCVHVYVYVCVKQRAEGNPKADSCEMCPFGYYNTEG